MYGSHSDLLGLAGLLVGADSTLGLSVPGLGVAGVRSCVDELRHSGECSCSSDETERSVLLPGAGQIGLDLVGVDVDLHGGSFRRGSLQAMFHLRGGAHGETPPAG